MALIGGEFGYQLLRLFHPREAENSTVSSAPGKTDLDRYFSPETISRLRGCVVIDFGCGIGRESVALAQRGAARVIGLDIQEGRLQTARESAERAGVTERCTFAQTTTERADVILSKDAFEHFRDPAAVLDEMASLLHPDGYVLATFGPTWLHPYGGHLFSVFPWSHLLFTEAAQIRWRCLFKADGATKFAEVEGGLNQLTIARFEQLVLRSPFYFDSFEAIPIRGIRLLSRRPFREFGTSLVRCRLRLRNSGHTSSQSGHAGSQHTR